MMWGGDFLDPLVQLVFSRAVSSRSRVVTTFIFSSNLPLPIMQIMNAVILQAPRTHIFFCAGVWNINYLDGFFYE